MILVFSRAVEDEMMCPRHFGGGTEKRPKGQQEKEAMPKPQIATVDPVDGTRYLIYEDSSVWAYRPPSKE